MSGFETQYGANDVTAAETFVLEDGEGLIGLHGQRDECALSIENRPVALTWADCQGSVGQYIVRTRNREGISQRLTAIRDLALNGMESDVSLSEQVLPLLSLFASGTYRLLYYRQFSQFILPWDMWGNSAFDGINVYPDLDVIVPTQQLENLNPERIDFFEQEIQRGKQPVAFAATVLNADCSFVLDGHHKLRAYEKLNMAPAVLLIVRCDPSRLKVQEGLTYLVRIKDKTDPFFPDRTWETEYRRCKSSIQTMN